MSRTFTTDRACKGPLRAFAATMIVLLVGFWSFAALAQKTGELGLKVVDVANRYTAAILSAKLCGQYHFQDKAQEATFNSNREAPHGGYATNFYLRLEVDITCTSAHEEVVQEGDIAFRRPEVCSVAVTQ